jgi:hypothetical protein
MLKILPPAAQSSSSFSAAVKEHQNVKKLPYGAGNPKKLQEAVLKGVFIKFVAQDAPYP